MPAVAICFNQVSASEFSYICLTRNPSRWKDEKTVSAAFLAESQSTKQTMVQDDPWSLLAAANTTHTVVSQKRCSGVGATRRTAKQKSSRITSHFPTSQDLDKS